MTPKTTTARAELKIRDFGPIAAAAVDIRPLTVFVGPSDSGKSYLAKLVYMLHRLFRSTKEQSSPQQPTAVPCPDLVGSIPQSMDSRVLDVLRDSPPARAIAAQALPDLVSSALPEALAAIIRDHILQLSATSTIVASEINRSFSIQYTSSIIRKRSNGPAIAELFLKPNNPTTDDSEMRLVLEVHDDGSVKFSPELFPKTTFWFKQSSVSRRIDKVINPPISHEMPLLANSSDGSGHIASTPLQDSSSSQLLNSLTKASLSFFLDPVCSAAHYLPAGRAGIMHIQDLVERSDWNESAESGSESQYSFSRAPSVEADFLYTLQKLSEPSRDQFTSRIGDRLANMLEDTVLGGRVCINAEDSMQQPPSSFRFFPKGWSESVSLNQAASKAAELGSLALYLRHIVQLGDLVIIEEPECHLHPENQVELVKVMASMVRTGVRLIVTTHSEWITEALANLVYAGRLSVSDKRSLDIDQFALAKDSVGVWFFDLQSKDAGTTVRELEFDDEANAFEDRFDSVAWGLHNQLAEMSSLFQVESSQ